MTDINAGIFWPTSQDVMDYSGIDYADDVVTRNVNRVLASAIALVKGAVGADVDQLLPDDSRVRELALIYADDLYFNRGAGGKVASATRRAVADLELQLRMECNRAREARA